MRRWILFSFLVGFALVGGVWAWIVYADETDIHQQSYRPEKAPTDALIVLLEFGVPSGLLTLAIGAGVRWSIKKGWWRSGES